MNATFDSTMQDVARVTLAGKGGNTQINKHNNRRFNSVQRDPFHKTSIDIGIPHAYNFKDRSSIKNALGGHQNQEKSTENSVDLNGLLNTSHIVNHEKVTSYARDFDETVMSNINKLRPNEFILNSPCPLKKSGF